MEKGNKRHSQEGRGSHMQMHASEQFIWGHVLAEYARISLCYEWIRH